MQSSNILVALLERDFDMKIRQGSRGACYLKCIGLVAKFLVGDTGRDHQGRHLQILKLVVYFKTKHLLPVFEAQQ